MVNTTAIIPIKIDTPKRKENIDITLRYILQNTNFDIILTECDSIQKFNPDYINSNRIKYRFEKSNSFHRTRLLNEMLNDVKTPVTINYDADVFLKPESYVFAEQLILKEKCDLIYPYGYEQFDQRMIQIDTDLSLFKKSLNISDIPLSGLKIGFCRFGHIQFFNTTSYRQGFMENENYRHWCPEDEERGIRFQKLGYKVGWFRNLIFHQEHPPSYLPPPENKKEIYELHEKLLSFDKQNLIEYYSNQNYLKKYDTK